MSDLEWNPLFLPSSSVVSGLGWPCRDRAVSSALPFRPSNLWSAIFALHLGQLCQRRPVKNTPSYLLLEKSSSTPLLFLRDNNRYRRSTAIDYGFHLRHFASTWPRESYHLHAFDQRWSRNGSSLNGHEQREMSGITITRCCGDRLPGFSRLF